MNVWMWIGTLLFVTAMAYAITNYAMDKWTREKKNE